LVKNALKQNLIASFKITKKRLTNLKNSINNLIPKLKFKKHILLFI